MAEDAVAGEAAAAGDEAAAIVSRLAALRARIAAACARAGRGADAVSLVAVSKRQPLVSLKAAYDAGQRIFGENRVQEALGKMDGLPADAEWHLIGPLQSNKVGSAAGRFAAIHSVDRSKIATLLDRAEAARGRRLPIFLEVHLGGEESKHGFDPATLLTEAEPLFRLPALEIVGLMCIPPYREDPQEVRPFFRQLRELRDRLASSPAATSQPGPFRGLLSMGMSHDFEVAIEEGATHVRVGTALFGERPL